MADEYKQMDVICGPYRGQRLTMTTADADAAHDAHWARDPFEPPEESHDPLTDAQRSAAVQAAYDWAQAQWDAAQNPEPPPPDPPQLP